MFIAYRWDDTGDDVHSISDGLAKRLPDAYFFTDLRIQSGEPVQERIKQELDHCDTIIVLIGDRWLDSATDGARRLDAPDDYVREEIEGALHRGLRLMPVLVDRAELPTRDQLPKEIWGLTVPKAADLRHGRDWPADLDALVARLTNPLQSPPRAPPPPRTNRPRPATLVAIAAVAAALFAGALALSSALSPDATQAARPTTSLKLKKTPAVSLTVPTFAGSPADLLEPPEAPLSSASNAPATGSTRSSTEGGSGTTGGSSAPVPVGPLEGSS